MRGSKPPWFKVRIGGGEAYREVRTTLRRLELHTVCQQACCPNLGECWSSGTATFLLMGPYCTRRCLFCHVTPGNPATVRPEEPDRVAQAVRALALKYVVLTMVHRDDLPDGGAEQVAATITKVRELGATVEALVGDFGGNRRDLDLILSARPDVFGHNLEVTRALQGVRDVRASYRQSLEVLAYAKSHGGARFVKSSLMVGLGERQRELVEALADLRQAGVDMVTLGQYASPSAKHAPVERWVTPHEFEQLRCAGVGLGFVLVVAGPLVRSSYRAAESFVQAALGRSQ